MLIDRFAASRRGRFNASLNCDCLGYQNRENADAIRWPADNIIRYAVTNPAAKTMARRRSLMIWLAIPIVVEVGSLSSASPACRRSRGPAMGAC
jgi:hypothetical protein